MQQQVSVITLGITGLPRSRRFYVEGFGWSPIFENNEIIFYQMNGVVLGTFQKQALEADMNQSGLLLPAAFSLAYNVRERKNVAPVMEQLVKAGGRTLRPAGEAPHGGFHGYVADPDGHAWEIAWNPAWAIDDCGLVRFGV